MSTSTGENIRIGSSISTHPSSPPSLGGVSVSTRDSTSTHHAEPPTNIEIAKKPWKYIGYKGYADFVASDNDLFIFRRFTSLNSRVALLLQDQLSLLEEQLEELDRQYSRKEADDINNGSFRVDNEDRMKVVEKIYEKLEKYNNFMIQQSQLKAFPQAYRPDVKSLRIWHENHGSCAINSDEQKYLSHDSDLFCIISKEKTPLRRLFDRSRTFRIHPLWRKEDPGLPFYDKDLILSISDKRIDRFITCLIVGVGTIMLIAPIWILEVMSKSVQKLVVITVFIIVFLAMISSVTVAKPFETLAATAAYSAVLMVFLQLGNTGGP